MKKFLDNLIVSLVVLLFLLVIVLVVKYNMIKEDYAVVSVVNPEQYPPDKKAQKKAYLKSLESYGEDKDVKVDPTKESTKNTVKVRSEETSNEVEAALNTDGKKTYVESLENYTKQKETTSRESLEDVKPKTAQNGDTIGDELENIVGE